MRRSASFVRLWHVDARLGGLQEESEVELRRDGNDETAMIALKPLAHPDPLTGELRKRLKGRAGFSRGHNMSVRTWPWTSVNRRSMLLWRTVSCS